MSFWQRNKTKEGIADHCIRMAFFCDFLMAAFAIGLAHLLRFRILGGVHSRTLLINLLLVVLGALLLNFLIFLFGGYYQRSLLRFRRSFPIIIRACLIWLLALPLITLFLEILPSVSRLFIILSVILLVLFVGVGRFVYLRLIRFLGVTADFRQRILLIDWTPRLAELAKAVTNDPWHPYEIVAVLPPEGNHFTHPPDHNYSVLGSHQELEPLLARKEADIVIVGDGHGTPKSFAALSSLCERYLVSFMLIPRSFQILLSGLQVTTISRIPVMGVMELPLEKPINSLVKRAIDLLGAILGLVIFSPVIAFFCLLVYLESPGPIFYLQTRSGRKGRHFRLIKIRSMKLDAEKETGARWASKNDDRRLRIGTFMRKWNIDELPQFWNVLTGSMSLVGPRPERPELIVGFQETIDHYNARHHITPGITGWAAVNGLRGDTDLQERIRYDLYYMENWSLALDLQIILMTFLRFENAG